MLSITFTPTNAEWELVEKQIRLKVLRPRGLDNLVLNSLFYLAALSGGFGAAGVLWPILTIRGTRMSVFVVSAICSSVAFLLLLIWTFARQATVRRLAAEYRKDKLVPLTIQISDLGLAVTSNDATSTYRWSGIQRIEVINDCTLFFTSHDIAPFAPSRAFGSRESFEQFVHYAREWHAKSTA